MKSLLVLIVLNLRSEPKPKSARCLGQAEAAALFRSFSSCSFDEKLLGDLDQMSHGTNPIKTFIFWKIQ